VLQQEVVERRYQFRLVADESIRKVVPQHLAALAVKTRLQENSSSSRLSSAQRSSRLAIAVSHTPFQTLVEGRFDAIREWSTGTCGTPIRPCFDSGMSRASLR
jgi:hypothetical protein